MTQDLQPNTIQPIYIHIYYNIYTIYITTQYIYNPTQYIYVYIYISIKREKRIKYSSIKYRTSTLKTINTDERN